MKKKSHRRRAHRKIGASPGILVADPDAANPVIRIIDYDSDKMEDEAVSKVAELEPYIQRKTVSWINVDGLGDIEVVKELGALLGLHSLALEDVTNVVQRPKVEDFEDHLFIVARMPIAEGGGDTEQVSMFVGRNYVLTFQEQPGDCFDAVRKRIREARQRIRSGGPDYLAYAILDAIVDSYFPLLDDWSERLEVIESEIVEKVERQSLIRLYELKRRFVEMRRILTATRDAANLLVRDDNSLITEHVRIYLRDVYDHAMQLVDSLDGNREYASSLMDFFLSQNGNRMNEIMKVLTIIATIFIPLTFIAGIYGMNFNPEASPWNMPELQWYWGYPIAIGIMIVIGLSLVLYFKRKGWLG